MTPLHSSHTDHLPPRQYCDPFTHQSGCQKPTSQEAVTDTAIIENMTGVKHTITEVCQCGSLRFVSVDQWGLVVSVDQGCWPVHRDGVCQCTSVGFVSVDQWGLSMWISGDCNCTSVGFANAHQ